jgi:hypothetical protein
MLLLYILTYLSYYARSEFEAHNGLLRTAVHYFHFRIVMLHMDRLLPHSCKCKGKLSLCLNKYHAMKTYTVIN